MSCYGDNHTGSEYGNCILGDGSICEDCGIMNYKIHKSHVNPETLNQLLIGEITFEEFISIIKNQFYNG